MDQELSAIMRDLVVEFPCCQDVDPMNMNKSQSAVHWFCIIWGGTIMSSI